MKIEDRLYNGSASAGPASISKKMDALAGTYIMQLCPQGDGHHLG
jgi:hypothetical protein